MSIIIYSDTQIETFTTNSWHRTDAAVEETERDSDRLWIAASCFFYIISISLQLIVQMQTNQPEVSI